MRLRYKKYSLMLAALLIFVAVILAVLQNARVTNLFQNDNNLAKPVDSQNHEQKFQPNNSSDSVNGDKSLAKRERGKR